MPRRRTRQPEKRDVQPRIVLWSSAGLVGFMAIVLTTLALLYGTGTPLPRWSEALSHVTTASPRLQISPAHDYETLKQKQIGELNKLEWVDKAAGIARIPIGQAMAIIAAHGLPDFGKAEAPTAGSDCQLLLETVPRAPQAEECRRSQDAKEKHGDKGITSSE